MRGARSVWLLLAVVLLVGPALLPAAEASPPRVLHEASFEGRIRAAGGIAGHADGLEPTAHGVLDLNEATSTVLFTVEWTSSPQNASLAFQVCRNPCWMHEDPTVLARAVGTSPLTLVAQAPGFDAVSWEAWPNDDAALDVNLTGRAAMHGHPEHPGPAERGERVGALSLGNVATADEGATGTWASIIGLVIAGASAVVSAAKPGTSGMLVGLYHRVERDALLDNENRARIVALVRERPGVHLEVLIEELDVARGTIQHHLRLLEDGELLTAEKLGGFRCYFLPGRLTPDERRALGALKSDAPRKLARAVRTDGPMSSSELAGALECTLPTVSHHVSRLQDAGVLEVRRAGRCCQLSLTEIGARALDGFPQLDRGPSPRP